MRKLTEKEIVRLLAARPTPEPPAGLADRIKAEIPGSIRIERPALQPGRRWLLPPLVEGLQPSWLAAASVLLVVGVGIVAARIPAQPDDLWKWMALSGVVHIDDIVVTAPEPREGERTLVAAAPAPAAKAVRQRPAAIVKGEAARSEAADALREQRKDAARAAEPAAGAAAPVAFEAQVAEERAAAPGAAAADAGANAASAAPERRTTEEVTATGGFAPSEAAAQAAPANRPARVGAVSLAAERDRGVTVVVLDQAGEPLAGATVTLERLGQGALWTRTATTEGDGTATFRSVPPSTYRALVTAPSVAPAQLVVSVTSERAPTRAEVRVRPLPKR